MKENLSTEKMPSLEGHVILRRATIADLPVLLELEKSVAGTNTYSATLEEDELKEELRTFAVYLIEKDAVVVGYVSYEKKDNNNAYISGLVVDPNFRGQGIGKEALIEVLNELKDFTRIDLVTHPDNNAAINLYQSLGFVIESRKENHFGDGEPRLVLAKEK